MTQTRQLAAIMFTDIVGYTSLMGNDEQNAFELLQKNRQVQKPIIEKHNGKFIKELGDGILASFNTVSDAVYAAIKIQEDCRAHNFQLRIGIHQGEVVFEAGDVFGDAVNIASRIQSTANPGCIFVSETVYDNIFNKKDIQAKFIKEATLKNVKEPVNIYEVVTSATNDPIALKRHSLKPFTNNSIAVLPFVNMSNDAEQEYFCDGISEEIINALSQLNNLRVIARTSAFTFKNKNVDVREIGKLLDVQTLLEGSVRKAKSHLRIATKLVSTTDGSYLWSDRYDRELEDIFSIQEDIACNVATALKGFLTVEEKEVIRRPETMIEAYEYFLKGRQFFHKLSLDQAKKMFNHAIEIDADYALAYAGLADVHSWCYEWEGSKQPDLNAAEKNSLKALSLAPNLSESHTARGYVLALGKKYNEAESEFREAIRLNSNSFDAYYLCGRAYFAQGRIEESGQMFRKASEVYPEDYQSPLLLAQSLRILGKEEAGEMALKGLDRARKQLELNPTDRRALSLGAGNLFENGNRDEAFEWMNKALELYPEDAGVLINATCLFARDNNIEKAFSLLELAVAKGYGKKEWMEQDHDYDSLRSDPRFQTLINKLQ